MNADPLHRAAQCIRAGGIVAYPTEAVYGLGCDPRDEAAVTRVLELKQRDPAKGLIVIAADIVQLGDFIEPLSKTLRRRLMTTWPGPVTWLVPARREISRQLCGNHGTLAVRVTAHPLCAALCREAQTALVSTSANRAGQPPARDSEAVRTTFGAAIDFILEGPLGDAETPTEIRDAVTNEIIRSGS